MAARQFKSLDALVTNVAASCFSFGFNTGIIAGAILYLTHEFPELQENAVYKGALTSSVFLGAFVSNMVSAGLADRFGRVPILKLMNIPFIVGACIAAAAADPVMVIAGRFVTGLAVGVAATLPNMYIAEIVPSESRGRLVGKAPLFGTLGICVAQVVSFAVAELAPDDNSLKWRIMLGLGAFPPVIQAVLTWRIPESPRWCQQRGLHDLAQTNNEILSNLQGGGRLLESIVEEGDARPVETSPATLQKMTVSLCAVAVGLSVMQQLSGVNAVVFYAPTFYSQLGVPDEYAILVGACNSMCQVGMTALLLKLIDSWGRKTMCFIGLTWMTVSMIMLGLVFEDTFSGSVTAPVAVGSILCYRLAFSLSLGPLPYIMVTELFPQHLRSKGVAISMMANWFLNTVVVFAVPKLLLEDKGGVFFAFSGVCVISIILVDIFLPETSGRSLEQSASDAQIDSMILKLFRGCCSHASTESASLEADACTTSEPSPESACAGAASVDCAQTGRSPSGKMDGAGCNKSLSTPSLARQTTGDVSDALSSTSSLSSTPPRVSDLPSM